jgi:hypothetical protein
MKTQHLGSCLCGAVHFTVDGAFERFYLCHCTHCRKDSGSAHSANLFSSTARLEWRSGQDAVRRFNLPGTRHAKCFCTVCGSALPYVSEDLLVIPAGSLDTALAMAPDAHIFTASRAVWDHELAGVKGYEEFPS